MLLFVYGTLKMGHYNHDRFGFGSKSEIISSDTVKGITLVQKSNLPYPFAIKEIGGKVKGEVYNIDDKTLLSHLDAMESSAGYKRELVTTEGGLEVSIYVDASNNRYPELKRFSEFKG